MSTIKKLREELEKAQIAQLEKIKKEWKGALNSFDEAREFLKKFEDVEIYLEWLEQPFNDIYGKDLKKKQWEEYVLSGIGLPSYKEEGFAKYSIISDDIYNDYMLYERGENLNIINKLIHDLEYEFEAEDQMVPVVKSRTTSNLKAGEDRIDKLCYQIEIPAMQVINDMIKWCLKHKCVGYRVDW